MNRQNLNGQKKICPQNHFPACKAAAVLLEITPKTAQRPCRSGDNLSSPACSSIDQQNDNLSKRVISCSGWSETRHARCIVVSGLPNHKIQSLIRLKNVTTLEEFEQKMSVLQNISRFFALLRGFLRENPGAKLITTNLNKI
jgi:hypothetical protein